MNPSFSRPATTRRIPATMASIAESSIWLLASVATAATVEAEMMDAADVAPTMRLRDVPNRVYATRATGAAEKAFCGGTPAIWA